MTSIILENFSSRYLPCQIIYYVIKKSGISTQIYITGQNHELDTHLDKIFGMCSQYYLDFDWRDFDLVDEKQRQLLETIRLGNFFIGATSTVRNMHTKLQSLLPQYYESILLTKVANDKFHNFKVSEYVPPPPHNSYSSVHQRYYMNENSDDEQMIVDNRKCKVISFQLISKYLDAVKEGFAIKIYNVRCPGEMIFVECPQNANIIYIMAVGISDEGTLKLLYHTFKNMFTDNIINTDGTFNIGWKSLEDYCKEDYRLADTFVFARYKLLCIQNNPKMILNESFKIKIHHHHEESSFSTISESEMILRSNVFGSRRHFNIDHYSLQCLSGPYILADILDSIYPPRGSLAYYFRSNINNWESTSMNYHCPYYYINIEVTKALLSKLKKKNTIEYKIDLGGHWIRSYPRKQNAIFKIQSSTKNVLIVFNEYTKEIYEKTNDANNNQVFLRVDGNLYPLEQCDIFDYFIRYTFNNASGNNVFQIYCPQGGITTPPNHILQRGEYKIYFNILSNNVVVIRSNNNNDHVDDHDHVALKEYDIFDANSEDIFFKLLDANPNTSSIIGSLSDDVLLRWFQNQTIWG